MEILNICSNPFGAKDAYSLPCNRRVFRTIPTKSRAPAAKVEMFWSDQDIVPLTSFRRLVCFFRNLLEITIFFYNTHFHRCITMGKSLGTGYFSEQEHCDMLFALWDFQRAHATEFNFSTARFLLFSCPLPSRPLEHSRVCGFTGRPNGKRR